MSPGAFFTARARRGRRCSSVGVRVCVPEVCVRVCCLMCATVRVGNVCECVCLMYVNMCVCLMYVCAMCVSRLMYVHVSVGSVCVCLMCMGVCVRMSVPEACVCVLPLPEESLHSEVTLMVDGQNTLRGATERQWGFNSDSTRE